MSEKRKAVYIMLLRYRGKKKSQKVELFDAKEWKPYCGKKYRMRVNGKWFDRPKMGMWFVTKSQFRDILFRSILK